MLRINRRTSMIYTCNRAFHLSVRIFVWATFSLFLLTARSTWAYDIEVVPDVSPETIYNWSQQRCDDLYIPDSPARAFRRADGHVALIATHHVNWMLEGPTLLQTKPVCRSLLQSRDYAGRDMGSLWIQAIYTSDGNRVVALVSQDLTKVMTAKGCVVSDIPGRCWINNILAAESRDMGKTFALVDGGDYKFATIGNDADLTSKGRYGAFTTSNIVQKDGFFYVFAGVYGLGKGQNGNCLFRTRSPLDVKSWLAWNGSDFTVKMDSVHSGERCRVVGRGGLTREVRSITLDKKSGKWIAVFASRETLEGDSKPIPGFYYSVSNDLFNWSKPRRIMPAALKPREEQSHYYLQYPSIIDPDSLSRNFDTIDGNGPLLFFTRSNLKDGKGTLNRDLQFVRLRIDRLEQPD